MTDFIWVYTTLPDKAQAIEMTKKLVKEKFIACANILQNMTSVYEWKGKICEDNETSVIMKTSKAKVNHLKEAILRLHPYECPAILCIPIIDGNDDFLNWIREQVKP